MAEQERRWGWVWGVAALFALGLALGVGARWWGSAEEAPPGAADAGRAEDVGEEVAAPAVAPVEVVEVSPIRGRVRAEGGGALGEVVVEARGSDGGVVSRGESDAEGRFLLRVPAGVWSVGFRRTGYAPLLLEGVQGQGPGLEVELALGEGLHGRVVSGAQGVGGARVQVGGAGLWPPVLTESDAEGRFAVPALEPGRYEVLVQGELEGVALAAQVEVEHQKGAEPQEIALSEAPWAQVRVVDAEDGAAVPGALVMASEEVVRLVGAARYTDAEGEAALGGVPWPRWVLQVQGLGYEAQVIAVGPGERAPETVELRRAARVRGVVVDALGSPVALARLRAVVETPSGGLWEVTRDTTGAGGRWVVGARGGVSFASVFGFVSEEDGSFEITGLPAGRAVIEARQGGLQPGRSGVLVLRSGEVEEGVTLVLLPGYRVSGRVVGPDGAGVAGARVELEAPGQGPLALGGVLRPGLGTVVVTDGSGWFEAAAQPGEVEVRASAAGFEGASKVVRLDGEEGAEPVELRLSVPGEAVQGRVVDGDGVPVDGASLRHIPEREAEARRADACRTLTHDGGRFLLVGCPDRSFVLGVFSDDPAWAPAFVRVKPGEEREIALVASAPASVEVVQAGEEGGEEEAVVGAEVRLTPVALAGDPPKGAQRELEVQGESDEAGRWSSPGVTPGRWRLRVRRAGLIPWEGAVEVKGGEGLTQRVKLEPAQVIAGTVVDRYGAVVEAAWVEACAGRTCAGARSDAAGQFEVTLERPGAVVVRAVHPAIGRGEAPRSDAALVVELGEAVVELEAWEGALEEVGLTVWRDGDSFVLSEVEGAGLSAGLRRGDVLLGVSEAPGGVGVEVVRGEQRRTIVVRSAGGL